MSNGTSAGCGTYSSSPSLLPSRTTTPPDERRTTSSHNEITRSTTPPMSASLDLPPVRGLLQESTPSRTPSSTGTSYDQESIFPVSTGAREKCNGADSSRQLGDFTAIWLFLESIAGGTGAAISPLQLATTSATTAARRLTPSNDTSDIHYTYAPPTPSKSEVPSLRSSGSPTKPRRVVSFAPAVGFSDEDINTASAAYTSATGLKTVLDDKTYTGVKAFVKHASQPMIMPALTSRQRKKNIIHKLLAMFPEDRGGLLKPYGRETGVEEGVHVFIDNSNILIGFYHHIKKLRGFKRNQAVRRPEFSFHGLSLILERGRPTAKKVLVGSSPITPVVLEARDLCYETSILERVEKERNSGSASSGSESANSKRRKVEQAVDEICHLKILESVLDYSPGTIVLASGDGAAGEYSPGFFRVIERCLVRGWTVELVSWRENLSGFYTDKAFLKKWKGKFRFVLLDGFAEELLA